MIIVITLVILGFFTTLGYYTVKAEAEYERIAAKARKTLTDQKN